MSTDSTRNENTYFIDAESGAELARLMYQERIVTQTMGGLFPSDFDPSSAKDVLDVGCGPGGWVLDVAHAYPDIHVTGLDISQKTVEYARTQAKVQWLDNASFEVMDVLQPLNFSDNSFDFVNARFISGFMPAAAWPELVRECLRITHPGEFIRLTEPEYHFSNSSASEKLGKIVSRAIELAGKGFSDGGRNVGITPMLGRFLRDAGCQNIQKAAYALDFSAGEKEHESQCQNTTVFFQLLKPFLIKTGVTTDEEFEQLYQQALIDMLSNGFCGIWFYLSAWGQKPY